MEHIGKAIFRAVVSGSGEGAQYAHPINASTLGFQNLTAALIFDIPFMIIAMLKV